MSILRTAADRGDRRRYLLLYGCQDADQIIFAHELVELAGKLSLTVVHALAEPPGDWDGETGFIDRDLLRRRLPVDLRAWNAFVCGSPRLVEGVLAGLEEVGLPADRVHAEQFVEV
jgi:ferredoxin-NADP reductase